MEEIKMAKILITGGAGYIGSHTALELLKEGYEVVVYDNLCNSSQESMKRVEELTGKTITFYEGDILNAETLKAMFEKEQVDAVIHCAALKAVGESVRKPLEYYQNNITGTLTLMKVMREVGVKNIVFSSSATVYGPENSIPYKEDMPVGTASSPYGSTKIFIEQILKDIYKADSEWSIALLRYFNPIGSHESGLLGEEPQGIPNNLMPYIVRVACGQLEELSVFGGDYNTPDGTCIRDYLHVVDLAKGHIKALDKLDETNGVYIYNLGTGVGYSVLDVVNTFVKATGKDVPYKITQRRAGDLPEFYADATKAEKELGWKAEKNLEDMCRDSWHYIEVSRKNG